MTEILDLEALRNAPIDSKFFPFCQVECFIKKEALIDVIHDFPKITTRGSIPAHRLKYGKFFQKLIDELNGPELRALVAEKFAIDLESAHPLLTVRGQTNLRDGHIHTDTPSKLMTLLLYLNEDWMEQTGNLRLLRDGKNLENYFTEITPSAGKLLVFKVTENCWHGHYPFIGKRQTLQLNYVTNQRVVKREIRKHSRSFTLKKIKHALNLD